MHRSCLSLSHRLNTHCTHKYVLEVDRHRNRKTYPIVADGCTDSTSQLLNWNCGLGEKVIAQKIKISPTWIFDISRIIAFLRFPASNFCYYNAN